MSTNDTEQQLVEMGQRWLKGEEDVTGWMKPDGTQINFNDKRRS